MSNFEYRQLALAYVEPAAQVISQAFANDPLISLILPLKRTRVNTLLKFFRVFRVYGEIGIKNGRGFGTGEPLQGVAYWKFPKQDSMSISIKSLGKFLPLLFTMYPIGYFNGRIIINRIDTLHEKYANEPHFYLDNLGVLPSAQGQGFSSRLIRPFLRMADEQKIIAYTDTVTPANVPFYEHFGFECVETSTVNRTGITVYALRRPIH